MRLVTTMGLSLALLAACGSGKTMEGQGSDSAASEEAALKIDRPEFNADSAYSFVEQLVSFGPRVPNTAAHQKSGDWLVKKLKGYGWKVTEQKEELVAFDGTKLKARNILAQINPEDTVRMLLVAHWDSRPWADKDPDPEKRKEPVLGANDGASGVGVILEIARQLGLNNSKAAVDILFVDAEDWGEDENEDSWALGTKYFAENPPFEGYHKPEFGILLDMVGSPDARFGYEYFSQQANPELLRTLWSNAAALGHGKYFHTDFGGAVTDDHVQLNQHGIPTIDIIDYRSEDYEQGFDPVWHTTRDDMKNISKETLRAVGETVMSGINR